MKKIILAVILMGIVSAFAFADYPPEGWTDSIVGAISRAENEEKLLLLAFVGSDWCHWCEVLDETVWEKAPFKAWAKENVVRVFLDSPRQIKLSAATIGQNQVLKNMLGVRGTPTVWLLDHDLSPLLQTGYRDGGPIEYIRHLEEDRLDIEPDKAASFRKAFRAGIEKNISLIP